MKRIKVSITFIEEVLGTTSNNPEIFKEYIASKALDKKSTEEEAAAIGCNEYAEKQMTVFPRNNAGAPILWDYQIKGFFKDSCSALRRIKDSESSKIKAFKKEIDGLVFVEPRKILLQFEGDIGQCQRPLRAATAQGERIALAYSETVPAGTKAEFEILMLCDAHEKAVKEWLTYGRYKGIGQWRNSGKGRFIWKENQDGENDNSQRGLSCNI